MAYAISNQRIFGQRRRSVSSSSTADAGRHSRLSFGRPSAAAAANVVIVTNAAPRE